MFPGWDWTLIAVSVSFHGVAILSTLFRLWYRWYTERLWWDDAWALLAFLADLALLVAAILEQPVSDATIPRFFSVGNRIISFAYPILMWAARISILTSIVRISHPEGVLKHVSFGTSILFGILGAAMFGQRLQLCIVDGCLMTKAVLITQTTADSLADVLLSALPIWFLRSVKLSRKRRILVLSAFSATMVINLVTITELVVCFQSLTSGSVIFEHVKAACSMMVCNLLVITTFVYRILHKGEAGLGDSVPDMRKVVEFTTVDLAELGSSQETSKVISSAQSGTTNPSTWSFRDENRSKSSGSVTAAAITVSTVSKIEDDSRSGCSIR